MREQASKQKPKRSKWTRCSENRKKKVSESREIKRNKAVLRMSNWTVDGRCENDCESCVHPFFSPRPRFFPFRFEFFFPGWIGLRFGGKISFLIFFPFNIIFFKCFQQIFHQKSHKIWVFQDLKQIILNVAFWSLFSHKWSNFWNLIIWKFADVPSKLGC